MPTVKDALGRGRTKRITSAGTVQFNDHSLAEVTDAQAAHLCSLPYYRLHDGSAVPAIAVPQETVPALDAPGTPPPPTPESPQAPPGKSLHEVVGGMRRADLTRAVDAVTPKQPPPAPTISTIKLDAIKKAEFEALVSQCSDPALLKGLIAQETAGKNRKQWLATLTARLSALSA